MTLHHKDPSQLPNTVILSVCVSVCVCVCVCVLGGGEEDA